MMHFSNGRYITQPSLPGVCIRHPAPVVALKLLTVYHQYYMGHETTSGQPQGYGVEMISSPEAVPPYAELGHADLVDRFYATQGDPVIGRELSIRLFAHADIPIDPGTAPLIGRDGTQIQLDGRPLTLADYVNYAAGHHLEAVESILNFLMAQPGTQDYEATHATIQSRLNIGGH